LIQLLEVLQLQFLRFFVLQMCGRTFCPKKLKENELAVGKKKKTGLGAVPDEMTKDQKKE
jgi:hypothetical protein